MATPAKAEPSAPVEDSLSTGHSCSYPWLHTLFLSFCSSTEANRLGVAATNGAVLLSSLLCIFLCELFIVQRVAQNGDYTNLVD